MDNVRFIVVGSRKCSHCTETKKLLSEKFCEDKVSFNSFLGFKELLYSYRKVFDNCIGETRYIPLTLVAVNGKVRGFVVGSRSSDEWDTIVSEVSDSEKIIIYGKEKTSMVKELGSDCINAIDEMKNFLEFKDFSV